MKKQREKDPASPQYGACHGANDLRAYRSGGLDPDLRARIYHHLNIEKCPRCRDLFCLAGAAEPPSPPSAARLRTMVKKLENKDAPLRNGLPRPIRIEKEQIWTTSILPEGVPGDSPLPVTGPVLVLWSGDDEDILPPIIRVLPLSFDTAFHLPGETVLLDKDNPLTYPVLVEIFNERPMLAANLAEYRGTLSRADTERIMAARERFFSGKTEPPDEEYLRWKEKELHLAGPLSCPVNEALWPETGVAEENGIEIQLAAYRKAADTSGLPLSEVSPHILFQRGDAILSVVQVRDLVLLRFTTGISGAAPPARIHIDGREVRMARKKAGVFETTIGYADRMPGIMEITADINEERALFRIRFRGAGAG